MRRVLIISAMGFWYFLTFNGYNFTGYSPGFKTYAQCNANASVLIPWLHNNAAVSNGNFVYGCCDSTKPQLCDGSNVPSLSDIPGNRVPPNAD